MFNKIGAVSLTPGSFQAWYVLPIYSASSCFKAMGSLWTNAERTFENQYCNVEFIYSSVLMLLNSKLPFTHETLTRFYLELVINAFGWLLS